MLFFSIIIIYAKLSFNLNMLTRGKIKVKNFISQIKKKIPPISDWEFDMKITKKNLTYIFKRISTSLAN